LGVAWAISSLAEKNISARARHARSTPNDSYHVSSTSSFTRCRRDGDDDDDEDGSVADKGDDLHRGSGSCKHDRARNRGGNRLIRLMTQSRDLLLKYLPRFFPGGLLEDRAIVTLSFIGKEF